ncbi:MAG TPA: c-type cytochrome [Usitatibacter sp.]|nr:c-type cytochrome [Usitatibacter sp.]
MRDSRPRASAIRALPMATGAAVAVALLAAAPLAARADRTGKEVVDQVCIKCHGTGKEGAPRIGDRKAWEARYARGLTSLSQSAIEGVRKMPPHGGNMALTDLELERAITYMVNESGGHWSEPINRAKPPPPRSGKYIVDTICAKCHATGVGGAPRIGDSAEWIRRAKQGFDSLVRSAINGHGGMPSRGGKADLTDTEIQLAVTYMFQHSVATIDYEKGQGKKP